MKQEFTAKSEFEVCVIVIPTNFGQPFGQKLEKYKYKVTVISLGP